MITLFSPAKINLFLRIHAKRADGYHDLSSLFQTITLGDMLTVSVSDREVLRCDDPSIPTDAHNLILKATRLFREKTGSSLLYEIDLVKRIPTKAGLGGGSSNAATMLWACRALTKMAIPTQTLMKWGSEIGSDVPFFFSEGTAFCTGRGERVLCLPPLEPAKVWIVSPQEGLPTAEVYRRLQSLAGDRKTFNKEDLNAFLTGNLACFNDLEEPAFDINPKLGQLKKELQNSGFNQVLLSGSGSSFFCLGDGKAKSALDCAVVLAHFLNRTASQWYAPA